MKEITIYINTNLLDGTTYTIEWVVEFKDLSEPKDLVMTKGKETNVVEATARKNALIAAFTFAKDHWNQFYLDHDPIWIYNSEVKTISQLLSLM